MAEKIINVDEISDNNLRKLAKDPISFFAENQDTNGLKIVPPTSTSTKAKLEDYIKSDTELDFEEIQKKIDHLALVKITKIVIDI